MSSISFLSEVVIRTPLYVWIILVVLIKRGLSASRDNVLSFPRMLIFPIIFIIWGLEKVIESFAFPGVSILAYVVLAMIGTPAGYVLYRRFRQFYQKDGVIYRSGTYMPMIVLMLNFLFKYVLNVVMSINPGVCTDISFNLFYVVTGGFLVGLTLGGILQAYQAADSIHG